MTDLCLIRLVGGGAVEGKWSKLSRPPRGELPLVHSTIVGKVSAIDEGRFIPLRPRGDALGWWACSQTWRSLPCKKLRRAPCSSPGGKGVTRRDNQGARSGRGLPDSRRQRLPGRPIGRRLPKIAAAEVPTVVRRLANADKGRPCWRREQTWLRGRFPRPPNELCQTLIRSGCCSTGWPRPDPHLTSCGCVGRTRCTGCRGMLQTRGPIICRLRSAVR